MANAKKPGRPSQKVAPKRSKTTSPKATKKKITRPLKAQQPASQARRRLSAAKLFAWFCVLVLVASVIFWTLLSTRLQRFNADQLIDGNLFQNRQTFHAASFPGAHSFLIKWPLFALGALFGNTNLVITVLTLVCTLVPVAVLAIILSKIERRPAVFGLLCLVLASMLLLVPAQTAPAVLLPVNLAMLTTRNVEYAVYLMALVWLVRSGRWRDRYLWLSVPLLTLLIASDKLFVALSVGGAILATAGWLVARKLHVRELKQSLPLRWLVSALLAFALAEALLSVINQVHLTHIINQASASPYPVVHSAKQALQGLLYAVGAVATNFGANPAYASSTLSGLPHALGSSFRSVSVVAYMVNAVLLLVGLWLTLRFLLERWLKRAAVLDRSSKLSLLLLASSLAALAVYVLTDHYYPVDARYLTICLFTLFIVSATYLRQINIRLKILTVLALALLVALPFAVFSSLQQYRASQTAFQSQSQFTKTVAKQLDRYQVGTLVGDYWDVTPIKSASSYPMNIVPLSSCRTPQLALNSTTFLHPTIGTSIAYLIDAKPPVSGFPSCPLAQTEHYYGAPTRLIYINAGGHVGSWLLIYDTGMKHLITAGYQAAHSTQPAAGVQPLVQTAQCPQATLLTVVAHQDDDLLFTNPDLLQAIRAGSCITTAYLTAGNAGQGAPYWLARQAGSEAAYSEMYGVPDNWHTRQALLNGQQVTVAYLFSRPQVNLVFFDLPDGNLQGQGFSANNFESLAQLRHGEISSITSVNGTTSYSRAQLITTITALMNTYQPTEIHTQDYNTNENDGDHSDHHATGYFTKQAFVDYGGAAVLKAYAGYPGRYLPANVSGQDLADKEAAFFAYAAHDPAVCQNMADCAQAGAYRFYIPREYSKVVAVQAITAASVVQPKVAQSKPSRSSNSCDLTKQPFTSACNLKQ